MTRREARAAAILLGCAAGILASGDGELNAQSVQLRPYAGLSLPTRMSVRNRELQVSQQVGMTVGARLTVRFNQRLDVVTGVSYAPGHATLRGAGKQLDFGTSSHLLTGTTGARYWLLASTRKLSWEVHTALGLVFGGQPAYEDLFESSTVSGILGTTLKYQVARIASLQLRIRNRVYRVRLGEPDGARSRHPLQISFGIGLPFKESAP